MNIVFDASHIPGRIRRVNSGILEIRHWGVEGWYRDVNGQPTVWHAQKGDVLRCTSYAEFSGTQQSEIVWTPETYSQRVSVIQRLQSIEGLRWNLATANCEQVVRWAVEGTAHSEQLVAGVAIALFVGATVLFAANA
jgi:hypothetical protein